MARWLIGWNTSPMTSIARHKDVADAYGGLRAPDSGRFSKPGATITSTALAAGEP